eukprot:PhF_6_TR3418/c0_g1_i5/m.4948
MSQAASTPPPSASLLPQPIVSEDVFDAMFYFPLSGVERADTVDDHHNNNNNKNTSIHFRTIFCLSLCVDNGSATPVDVLLQSLKLHAVPRYDHYVIVPTKCIAIKAIDDVVFTKGGGGGGGMGMVMLIKENLTLQQDMGKNRLFYQSMNATTKTPIPCNGPHRIFSLPTETTNTNTNTTLLGVLESYCKRVEILSVNTNSTTTNSVVWSCRTQASSLQIPLFVAYLPSGYIAVADETNVEVWSLTNPNTSLGLLESPTTTKKIIRSINSMCSYGVSSIALFDTPSPSSGGYHGGNKILYVFQMDGQETTQNLGTVRIEYVNPTVLKHVTAMTQIWSDTLALYDKVYKSIVILDVVRGEVLGKVSALTEYSSLVRTSELGGLAACSRLDGSI